MSAYLRRLAAHALNGAPAVHPKIGSLFAPREQAPSFDTDSESMLVSTLVQDFAGRGETAREKRMSETTPFAAISPDAYAPPGSACFAPVYAYRSPQPASAPDNPEAPVWRAPAWVSSGPPAHAAGPHDQWSDATSFTSDTPSRVSSSPAQAMQPNLHAADAAPRRAPPEPAIDTARRIAAALAAQRTPAAVDTSPDVRIHIGRIEVMPAAPAASPPASPGPARRAGSLDDYLKRHGGGSGSGV